MPPRLGAGCGRGLVASLRSDYCPRARAGAQSFRGNNHSSYLGIPPSTHNMRGCIRTREVIREVQKWDTETKSMEYHPLSVCACRLSEGGDIPSKLSSRTRPPLKTQRGKLYPLLTISASRFLAFEKPRRCKPGSFDYNSVYPKWFNGEVAVSCSVADLPVRA